MHLKKILIRPSLSISARKSKGLRDPVPERNVQFQALFNKSLSGIEISATQLRISKQSHRQIHERTINAVMSPNGLILEIGFREVISPHTIEETVALW